MMSVELPTDALVSRAPITSGDVLGQLRDVGLLSADGGLRFRELDKASVVADGLDQDEAEALQHQLEHCLGPALMGEGSFRLCKLVVSPSQAGKPSAGWGITLGPGTHCGFCTIEVGDESLFVRNEPKIHGADELGLSVFAKGELKPKSFRLAPTATLQRGTTPSLIDILVSAYATSLDRFFHGGGGLRRLHERRSQVLFARKKGQLDVPRYLREFANGRPLRVPCRFQHHDVDNLPNRTLLRALDLLTRVAQSVPAPTAVLTESMSRLDGHLARFAGVRMQSVSVEDLRRLVRLPQAFEHYDSSIALPLARLVIERFHLTSTRGHLKTLGFSVSMDKLFEKAFANLVSGHFGDKVTQSQANWHFLAGRREGSAEKRGVFKPDVVVDDYDSENILVMDTKWKNALPTGVSYADMESNPEEDEVRIEGLKLQNADVFQICSYAYLASLRDRFRQSEIADREESVAPDGRADDEHVGSRHPGPKGRPGIGILVYPVAGLTESDLDLIPLRWEHANGRADATGSSDVPIAVYALPWEVGTSVVERLPALFATLDRLQRTPLEELWQAHGIDPDARHSETAAPRAEEL